MKTTAIIFLVLMSISPSSLFSQKVQKGDSPVLERDKSPVLTGQKKVAATEEVNTSDYKIIASNSSYIEIEFYPRYNKPNPISFQGQNYLTLDFEGAIQKSMKESGQPDLRKRVFNILLPSDQNNRVTITGYKVNEASNINLAPLATMRTTKPNARYPEDYEYLYLRDSKAYSENKYMPENIASLEQTGPLRDLTITNLTIYPYQYNPVTKQMKQYTMIRVRVNFGQAPYLLNRPKSREEINLLKGVALNSDIAMNWISPKIKQQRRGDVPIHNSPFAAGDWYKIEVKDNGDGQSEGIYKISKSFLESAGINLTNVDPRTIKMYGNGGSLLPEDMTVDRPDDIQPIPIFIQGEQDGHFDDQDYILFYSRSVNWWTYDTLSGNYNHHLNYYSGSNYYWICINTPGNGLRMNTVASENGNNPTIVSSFRERIFYEPEINNLLNEGNLWLSQNISNNGTIIWNTNLTGLVAYSNILYIVKPAARVLGNGVTCYARFLFKDDNTSVGEHLTNLICVEQGFGAWINTDTAGFFVNASAKVPPNSEAASLRGTFQCSTTDGEGYLDWMEIQYDRRLNSAANDILRFDSPNVNGLVEYNVSSFSSNDIKVFDVTGNNSVEMITPIAGSNASDVKFQKTQVQSSLSRFIVHGPANYPAPTSITQRVGNQNLHGISDGASFVIITNPDFMSDANRIMAKREAGGPGSVNYLNTKIFTCDQIYNEFSGGVLDAVAIRDFLKYAYDNWQERPVYVLLLGNGSFDYKSLLNIPNTKEWVPVFEVTDPQIDQVAGYVTDDFFVIIDPNSSRPAFGIGRIPSKNVNGINTANDYLDKIDCYEDNSNDGYWKNRMIFVADDGYTGGVPEGSVHTDQCEELAENHVPQSIDKIKLYLIEYPAVVTAQGLRKPACNTDIINSWNAGCLNVHYTGHGSPDVWAHEYVLEKSVIVAQLHNKCLYPFVSIASCDMSKFDNPQNPCAAEEFVMTPNEGAIGTLAASRPVYSGANATFMDYFFDKLYQQRDTLLYPLRFGKAIFQCKQSEINYTENDKKFIMLCDPSLRVATPRFRTRVDSISGLSSDTMRALSRIKIYGSVVNPDSTLWSTYNGTIFVKVYDVTRQIEIDQEYMGLVYAFRFKLPGGIIYSGLTHITNGKWTAEYIVPRDLSYLNQNGKLVNYFYNNQADGSGLYTNFIVGGIDQSAPVDTTGPKISAYLNDRNFRSGDVVNENFSLISDMFDESGINTTGTIGHKIEATLDNNESSKYDLTTYYNSDTSYKSGSLTYNFTGISVGTHSLKIKAWDTYNNSSEVTINFDVVTGGALQVMNVYNFPNPFRDGTAFTFQHNYAGLVSTKIKIYTVAGRMIKEIDQPPTNDKFVYIPWNGKDADGETLANGIYIYKVVVTTDGGTTISNVGKLAVLK